MAKLKSYSQQVRERESYGLNSKGYKKLPKILRVLLRPFVGLKWDGTGIYNGGGNGH